MVRLNFREEDWERVERDTMTWWDGELDRPLVWLAVTSPVVVGEQYAYISNYPLDKPAEEIVDLYEPLFADTQYYGDAFPWWWINFGPGILAGFLGANVNSVSEPSETVWFSPAEKCAIRDLHLQYKADNIWWKRVKDITAAIVERFAGHLAVSMTDLGGNLDILASFRDTEGLLYDVVDQPQEVDRLAGEITALWLRYYSELDAIIRPTCRGTSCWTPIWSSGKTYMLQSDFSYMMSPAMFERYVLPDLVACCDFLDHGFYHLDGKGQIPHLEHLLSIRRLRGIQWIPGDGQPPPNKWLPLLKRIRDGEKLCQVFVDPQGALEIVSNLGGKNFLLVIENFSRDFDNPEQAKAFLEELRRQDISQDKKLF
jgi:5-methyltetrahydrofolate--homocysteine methyltransferase